MNKLDAISRRSKGMRALVRLVKIAITGCGACVLIASSTQLRFGGVTYALDSETVTGPHTFSVQTPETPIPGAIPEDMLNEDVLLAQFPEEPAPAEVLPVVYERPGAAEPEGWVGNAVTIDGDGIVSLWGTPITDMTAKTPAGTPAESDAVDASYFSDALFIGNSLVVGLQKSAAITDTTYYANIGLSVKHFFEKPFLPSPDGASNADGSAKLLTAAEAVAQDNDFRRVYLMFGVNELGWPNTDAFVERYELLIDTILTVRPDAVIYVQAIFPINETVYTTVTDNPSEYYTNERISAINDKLRAMAERKQVVYLTPAEVIADEDGKLPAEATTDGIHLSAPYIRRWASYLQTHTVADIDAAVFYEDSADTEITE